jgi:hypothetical protein
MTTETTVTKSEAAGRTGQRSIEALVFDIFLLIFVGTLVSVALFNLGPGARLVPLIVGIPTLIGILGVLLFDLFPGLRAILPGARPTVGQGPPPDRSVTAADIGEMALEGEAEEKPEDTPEARKREATFALWAIGFFILTIFTGLLVSIPIALLVFFKVLNRESWLISVSITVGTWLFIYVLFGMVLGVRF